jgi:ESS family glutamate:Na+ symporter
MEIFQLEDGVLQCNAFMTFTLGVIVLFVGKRLNGAIGFLREFSIPEPVSGGLFFSILFWILYSFSGLEIDFDLTSRDFLLVYFFTTIGINARFKDLLAGGKPLVILLLITVVTMLAQNVTGISVAALFDMDAAVGLLSGTVSLIGGHGTAIAWSPRIAEDYGIGNAMEIGLASATLGLILASLMGGPIAKFLVNRHNLKPEKIEPMDVGLSEQDQKTGIGYLDFLDAVLAIHICGIIGLLLNDALSDLDFKLPLFVTALVTGIVISNSVPKSFPRISGLHWPSRTPAMALIADISLGTFLAMSLMSMQLWTLIDLALPILTILAAQFAVVALISLVAVFHLMGRNYDAAVISAGFGGYALGATPVAMANMSAVTLRYGASHMAFIIVPLVAAFFIDLVNALIIPFFLASF